MAENRGWLLLFDRENGGRTIKMVIERQPRVI